MRELVLFLEDSTTGIIYDPITDSLSTTSGTYPATDAFRGGVLLTDGRVFCVPATSTTARIYGSINTGKYDANIVLSAYCNKF